MPDLHPASIQLKKRRLTLLTACLILLLAPSVLHGAPLAITKNRDLAFGRFVGGSGHAGTISINPSGTRSAAGTVYLVSGDPYYPAQFTITGTGGSRYSLTLPASFTVTSGGALMTVSQLTPSIATTGVLPAEGTVTFSVGGTLTLTSTQGRGSYSGSFDVSVTKN